MVAGYEFAVSASIRTPGDRVLTALVTPSMMTRWMVGVFEFQAEGGEPAVGSVYALRVAGTGARSASFAGSVSAHYVGTITEIGPRRAPGYACGAGHRLGSEGISRAAIAPQA